MVVESKLVSLREMKLMVSEDEYPLHAELIANRYIGVFTSKLCLGIFDTDLNRIRKTCDLKKDMKEEIAIAISFPLLHLLIYGYSLIDSGRILEGVLWIIAYLFSSSIVISLAEHTLNLLLGIDRPIGANQNTIYTIKPSKNKIRITSYVIHKDASKLRFLIKKSHTIKNFPFKCKFGFVDDSYIYLISKDKDTNNENIAILDKESLTLLTIIELDKKPTSFCWKSKKYFMVAMEDDSIVVIDKKQPTTIHRIPLKDGPVPAFCYDEPSDKLYIGQNNGKILIINNFSKTIESSGEVYYTAKTLDHADTITCIHCDQYLYIGHKNGKLSILKKENLKTLASIHNPNPIISITPIRTSENSIDLVILHEDGTLRKLRFITTPAKVRTENHENL